jgi:miniconductance mechanosensitive channel
VKTIIQKAVLFVSLWLGVVTINGLLDAFNEIYESRKTFKGEAIESYLDLVKILVFAVGIIMSISLITGESPLVLLTGLGAFTAVLLLVFRDTILGLVASFQISANDLVLVGDWLEVPAYNADGDVAEINLHQIKIRNWDKTISIVPTYKILDVAYKNWRGMSESGGRRIKRSVHLDVHSIRFCDEDMLARFKRIQLLQSYIEDKQQEIEAWNAEHSVDNSVVVNGRRFTNIGTFRKYIEFYLREHPRIRQDMTLVVRQQPPGPEGVSIEIYCFTNTTDWVEYEDIQANIFDHLLAVASEFDLAVFQTPSGTDFGKFLSAVG